MKSRTPLLDALIEAACRRGDLSAAGRWAAMRAQTTPSFRKPNELGDDPVTTALRFVFLCEVAIIAGLLGLLGIVAILRDPMQLEMFGGVLLGLGVLVVFLRVLDRAAGR